jgi:hypothetical protein
MRLLVALIALMATITAAAPVARPSGKPFPYWHASRSRTNTLKNWHGTYQAIVALVVATTSRETFLGIAALVVATTLRGVFLGTAALVAATTSREMFLGTTALVVATTSREMFLGTTALVVATTSREMFLGIAASVAVTTSRCPPSAPELATIEEMPVAIDVPET